MTWLLKRYAFYGEGFDTIFVFAAAIISYALASQIGGNGYLSVYLTGIILGNQELKNQKALVGFFDAFTGMMQMLLFFLLGLLAFPSQMPSIVLPAIAIALFLTFVARPAAVGLLLAPSKPPIGQYLVISWAGLRGAASIVFAIMATLSEGYMKHDIFHIVFCVVLFSIIFQGSLLPKVAEKCDMIDNSTDVMRTFSDYTGDMQIQFVQLPIGDNHPWKNRKICEIEMLPGMLITVIRRGVQTIVPILPTTKTVQLNSLQLVNTMRNTETRQETTSLSVPMITTFKILLLKSLRKKSIKNQMVSLSLILK